MDHSHRTKRIKLTPIESEILSPELSSSNTTTNSAEISTHGSSISHLPKELLSAIIDYIPKTQWPSLELVNRSFRDAVHSSWQSMKEFDMDKDVFGVRQSFNNEVRLSNFLPTILAKLLLRAPLLQSIIGFPPIRKIYENASMRCKPEIIHIISQFTNLKQIDFGVRGLTSVELVHFLSSSSSRDRLVEIYSSADYMRTYQDWADISTVQENYESRVSRLNLEKLCLKNKYLDGFLNTRIIDLINLSSLTVLVLEKITAPSDYLLSLITDCNQLKQLQFSFMSSCRCETRPCVHLASSKKILEAIAAMENLDSLKIGMVDDDCYFDYRHYLDLEDKLSILIDRIGRRGRLVEFGLLHGKYCSHDVVMEITIQLADLKSLELFTHFCSTPTLVNMIKTMVGLEKLTLNCTYEISAAFQEMATHLQNLKSFNLRFPSCSQMQIDCLHVLTRLEHLEELSITNASCNNVEWESTFGHQLKSLELRNCNEELVTTFLKQAPGLRRLVISGSFPFSDKVLRMTCPQLREFSMFFSDGLIWADNMEDVQAIIDGCPELEQLCC